MPAGIPLATLLTAASVGIGAIGTANQMIQSRSAKKDMKRQETSAKVAAAREPTQATTGADVKIGTVDPKKRSAVLPTATGSSSARLGL